MNFCSHCGARVKLVVPPGDDRPRDYCEACQTIHYQNPKMVVGCIPEWEDKILLCRRSIEPRLNRWTIPAGFLENQETVSEGAQREAWEEVGARVEILQLYTVVNLTHVSQVYLIFRARLVDDGFQPGHECHEVRLFSEAEMPWEKLAFSAVIETLRLYFQDRTSGVFPLHIRQVTPR